MDFDFQTDSEAEDFCEQIVAGMVRKYGLSRDEAIARVNRHWAGLDLRGEEHDIYHWSVSNWVDKIYEGYEELKVKGLVDLTREEIIERRRQFIERSRNALPPDLPPLNRENCDE